MKIAETNVVVERGFDGPIKENTFKIKPSAKAFKILSDGLYTDKIKAIVRELSCNAYDSHVLAGKKNTPFDVQLPTQLEHTFRIRDYGVGLSEEQVFELYTTYFESTKTESNDFVGALGLGSKSPFSYTDSFTVTSWWGGQKKSYAAFINETGFPHITKLSEADSDEPNGVEVQVSTKPVDYINFQQKAQEIYSLFNPVPNIIGRNIRIEPVDYSRKTKDFGIRKNNRYVTGSRAIVGPVAYPIDPNVFSANGALRELISFFDVDVFLEIGDVEIAASREALSLNKQSIEKITEKLKFIEDEMKKDISDKIASSKTLWDAHIVRNEFLKNNQSNYNMQRIIQKLASGFTHSSQSLDSGRIQITKRVLLATSIKRIAQVNAYGGNSYVQWERPSSTDKWYNQDLDRNYFTVAPDKNTNIVVMDKALPIKELKKHITGTIYYINCIRKDKETTKDFSARLKSASVKSEIMKLFGGKDISYSSDIAIPEGTRITAIRKKQVYVIPNHYYYYSKTAFSRKEIDFNDGGVYVEFSGGKPLAKTLESWGSKYADLVNRNILPRDFQVYGVSQLDIDDVKKNPKWIDLDTYVRGKVEAALDKKTLENIEESIFHHQHRYKIDAGWHFLLWMAEHRDIAALAHDKNLLKLMVQAKKYSNYKSDPAVEKLRNIAIIWKVNFEKIEAACTARVAEFLEFYNKYPLVCNRVTNNIVPEHIIEYMNWIYSKG